MGMKEGTAREVPALLRAGLREQRKLIEQLVAAIQKHCTIDDPLLREADRAEEYLRLTSGTYLEGRREEP